MDGEEEGNVRGVNVDLDQIITYTNCGEESDCIFCCSYLRAVVVAKDMVEEMVELSYEREPASLAETNFIPITLCFRIIWSRI